MAVIVAVVVAIVPLDAWLAVVGAVVLVISTSEALLPTRYRLTDSGVQIVRPFTRSTAAWSRFQGFTATEDGFVLLGAGSRPTLRRLRTVQLRAPLDGERVAHRLAQHLGAPCAS